MSFQCSKGSQFYHLKGQAAQEEDPHYAFFSIFPLPLWCQNILYSRLLSHTLNLYETRGSRSGDYEKYCLLECDTIKCRRSVLVFERIWLSLHQVRCPDKVTAGPLEM